MNQDTLAEKLKKHLKRVEGEAGYLYLFKLKRTIENLEKKVYQENEEGLVEDLQILGFGDLAVQVKRRQYT